MLDMNKEILLEVSHRAVNNKIKNTFILHVENMFGDADSFKITNCSFSTDEEGVKRLKQVMNIIEWFDRSDRKHEEIMYELKYEPHGEEKHEFEYMPEIADLVESDSRGDCYCAVSINRLDFYDNDGVRHNVTWKILS